VPVTVWEPAAVAVQVAAAQVPVGLMPKVVDELTSPMSLLKTSKPSAVYAWWPPAVTLALAGLSTRWSTGAAVTVSEAVPALPPSGPVTVWAPAMVAVQLAPVQDPSGLGREPWRAGASPRVAV